MFREEVSQKSASLRMGINGESENSDNSNGNVGIQNLPEAGGSESSFALAPPISAPGAVDLLDSPTMVPKTGAHELSLPTSPESKVAEGCAELDLNTTSHYTHMERGVYLRQGKNFSLFPFLQVRRRNSTRREQGGELQSHGFPHLEGRGGGSSTVEPLSNPALS